MRTGACYPILRDRKTKFTDCRWFDDDGQQVFEDDGDSICIDNALPLEQFGGSEIAELPSTNFFVGTCQIPEGGTKTVGRGTPYALRVTNPLDCLFRDDDGTIIVENNDDVILIDNAEPCI